MNILITGASGFIGSHITQKLIFTGHNVTVCVRNSKSAQQHWPTAHTITTDFSKDHKVSDWLPRLNGIDIVINAVGIIRETGTQTFESLHTTAPCALFKACEQAGVNKVIQISALNADETAFSKYHLSKRAADEYLTGMNLNWSILLPSIVYGPGAKSMAFFMTLASLPWIPVIEKGDQPIQPVHISDLVEAVLQLIQEEASVRQRIELVGPEAIAIKEIYTQLRLWLGLGKSRFISLPYRLSLIAGRFGDFLGNSPMTTESIQMLQRGNTADVTPFVKQFGFEPVNFKQVLATTPSQQADRWHAGLYFIKPLLRLSIAFLWIFTGIISAFVFPPEQSYAMLAKVGITGAWAPLMLYGAIATDFALGLATLMAYRLSVIGLIQIAVITLYSIIITFSQPELWIHPFGPVSKNIPIIIAILTMIVLERK